MVNRKDEERFWQLIDRLAWRYEGSHERVIEPVIAALEASPVRQIEAFFELLARAAHVLDTPRHYSAAGEPSGDLFLYARLGVIANGYDFFSRVLRYPGQFPKEIDFEPLLWVADRAYLRKTGEEFDRPCTRDYESFTNPVWADQ